jgi:hypothetical protein
VAAPALYKWLVVRPEDDSKARRSLQEKAGNRRKNRLIVRVEYVRLGRSAIGFHLLGLPDSLALAKLHSEHKTTKGKDNCEDGKNHIVCFRVRDTAAPNRRGFRRLRGEWSFPTAGRKRNDIIEYR